MAVDEAHTERLLQSLPERETQALATREAVFIFLFLFLNIILLPVCCGDSKEYLGQAKISHPRL